VTTWTKKVQLRLAELGFDPGPADGILGPRTREAINEAQDWHKLTAGSDIVDDILWPDGVIEDRQAVPVQPLQAKPGPWPHESGVPAFYGAMGKHLKMLDLPYPMRLSWDLGTQIKRFSIHEKCHASAARCFKRIAETFDAKQRADLGIDLFGGCLSAPRKKRGGSTWSMHSWGVAIDFDPERNQLKWGRDRARLGEPDAVPFWEIWEAEGWLSLGRARGFDFMHVQCARL
jgi:hypothetical protein